MLLKGRGEDKEAHVWTAADETARSSSSSAAATAAASRAAPPATLPTRVLGRQMRVLGLVGFAKVALLHDGRQS